MGQTHFSSYSVQTTVGKISARAKKFGFKAHHLANDLMDACRQKSDLEGMQFWRTVWIQLMAEIYRPVEATGAAEKSKNDKCREEN